MVNMDRFTMKAQEAIQAAVQLAEVRRQPTAEPEHLLHALLTQDGGLVPRVVELAGASHRALKIDLEKRLESLPEVTGSNVKVSISSGFIKVLEASEKLAKSMDDAFVSTEHILMALVENASGELQRPLEKSGLNPKKLKEAVQKMRGKNKVTDENPEAKFEALKKYAKDLTSLAEEGKLDPVVGRDEEIRRVIQVLSRRTKNNPVLIGEPGVGKTAIAEGLALRILNGDVPEVLQDRRLMALDMGSLVAGAKYRGEFEDRLKAVIKEVTDSDGQIILFIDEIHTLVGAGKSEGAMDAGQILKPALARGELRCIGATTLDEYRKFIEKDKALERRFQTVMVEEPSVPDAITILRGLKEKYEVHHGVRITDSAIIAAVKLSHRYITSRFLPDKAIDLMDEAASRLSIEIKSVPSAIDEIQRKIMQLQIEREALKKEKDSGARERLGTLDAEVKDFETRLASLKEQWQAEKAEIGALQSTKQEIESVRIEIERAEREGNLGRAAELKYGRLPELEKNLAQADQHLGGQVKSAEGGESARLEKGPASAKTKSRMLKEEVGPEEIAEVVAKWTGVPVQKMLEGETDKLLKMEDHLRKRVVGQDQALTAVADAIRRARAEISDPRRPIGSFIFLGPTGVGKTETVKALAEFMFDTEDAVVRLDMSEYMEKHAVSRLIGAPPGYVGYEEGGQLTERVRRRPYSVVLFDEIEKAHPEVFNVLLQVLDDGRLTDGQGRTVDFKNTVIIMTSNVGSSALIDEKLSRAEKEKQVMAALRDHFRPEFLNRIDETVIFNPLEAQQIRGIVSVQLQDVKKRLSEKKIGLSFSDQALDYLAERGYDPVYGARPLKRVIQNEVLNPLAKDLISNQILPNQTVHVEVKKGKLVFSV